MSAHSSDQVLLEHREARPDFASVVRRNIALLPALLLARLADLGKFMVIARAFGASPAMDAFWVALSIPAGVGGLVESTAEQGFVVMGTRASAEKEGSDWTLQAHLLRLAVLALGLLSFIYGLCAGTFIAVVGRGLALESRVAAARLTQLLAPVLLLSPVLGLLTGFHYARGRFLCRTLAPATGVLVVACCLWWLRSRLGIYSLAVAYSAAYAVQLFLLLPLFWDSRRKRAALTQPLSYYGRALVRFLLPMLLVSWFTNMNLILDRLVASFLPPGSISYVDYANRLGFMFSNLMVGGFVMVFYPFVARQAAAFDASAVAAESEKALRLMALVMVPTLAVTAWLRVPTVRLLFERGAFSRADSVATGRAFAALAPGLLFLAFNMVLIRGFYSLHDSRLPMFVAAASVVPNLLLDILLARSWGFAGIALSTSAVQMLMFLLLVWLFHRQHAHLRWGELAAGTAKMLLAAAAAVAAVQLGLRGFGLMGAAEEAGAAIAVVAALLTLVLYFTACYSLRIRECQRLLAWFGTAAIVPAGRATGK